MAIKPGDLFPGQSVAPSADYPLGSAQNITTPGDGTGTPLVAAILNDTWGFHQKLLNAAGLVASGDPDTVPASQYYEALVALFSVGAASLVASGKVQLTNVLGTSDALAATQSLVNALSTALTPVIAGDYSKWSVKIGRFKIQGGAYTIDANETDIITFSGVHTAYTGAHVFFGPIIASASTGDANPLKGGVVNSSSGRIINTNGSNVETEYISIGWDAA